MPLDNAAAYPVAAHLMRAQAYIEEYGWVQHRMQSDEGVCPIRAICRTATRHNYFGAIDAFRKANRISTSGGITGWSDAPERTIEDIYAGFDRAIALATAESAV